MARAFFGALGIVLIGAGGAAAYFVSGAAAVGGAAVAVFGAYLLGFGLVASGDRCGNAANWFLTVFGI
jgi:hypothetical protein